MTDPTASTWDRKTRKSVSFHLSFPSGGAGYFSNACHEGSRQATSAVPDSARGSGGQQTPRRVAFREAASCWIQRVYVMVGSKGHRGPRHKLAGEPGSPSPCWVMLARISAPQPFSRSRVCAALPPQTPQTWLLGLFHTQTRVLPRGDSLLDPISLWFPRGWANA